MREHRWTSPYLWQQAGGMRQGASIRNPHRRGGGRRPVRHSTPRYCVRYGLGNCPVAAMTTHLQPRASSQDPIAQNNAVFYAVSAVSLARECVGSVWSDLADSNLLVSRNWGWRLRFLALTFWVLSTKFCSNAKPRRLFSRLAEARVPLAPGRKNKDFSTVHPEI